MILGNTNRWLKYLNNEIQELDEYVENQEITNNENQLFNLYDLYKKHRLTMCNRLNILGELQKKLYYESTDFIEDFDFNFNIIQNRMIKYSEGLISKDFPFCSYNYFIAGGFVLNSLIGVNSRYTDIDIYIYNNFEKSVEVLIEYFEEKVKTGIKMTYSKSIINIYPIGYNINIQLINFVGLTPDQIISNFDMSYSQMGLFNWDDHKKQTIEMTFLGYKTITSGLFNLNRNAIIRNYRIIKGYVKGFILDPNEFCKSHKNNEYQYNLLNDVRKLIGILSNVNNTDVEKILIEHLTNQNNINDYKLMTKSVFIGKDDIDIGEQKLEELTGCKYFDYDKFNPNDFEPLKFYINYDCHINDDNDDNSDNFPEMKTINCGSSDLNLIVNTGDYYKSYKNLNSFKIKLNCKVSDIKLINIITTDNGASSLVILVPFNINNKLKSFISNLDARIYKILATRFRNQFKTYNFKKIIQNEDQEYFKIIVGSASFIKNIIYKNQLMNNNVNTYNNNLNKLKTDIQTKINTKRIKDLGVNLDSLEDCNININDELSLIITINGIIYNKIKNEYLYNLKTIINLS
jgi:hypothetical protein